MIQKHLFDFISSVSFCSEEGSDCVILSENIFFVASCIFISCNGKHIISIFLESRWETNIFPQRFRKHKNQMQTYISYYLMLRYASVSIVN